MTLIQLNKDKSLHSSTTGKIFDFKKGTLFTIFNIHPNNTVITEYGKDDNINNFYYESNLLLHPRDYMDIIRLESTEDFINKLNETLNDL